MTRAIPAPLGTLIVIAKRPEPGAVKTRLVPPLRHDEAAALAAAALRDTLHLGARVRARRRVLSFAGCPDGWLPDGWQHHVQPAGGLDARLAAAFAAVPGAPAMLVGMDTPQLRVGHLAAFDYERFDACLGPARDGGFWTIGFRDPSHASRAIPGVAMSQPGTGAEQLRRLQRLGLRVQVLDELTDVDTIDTAVEVAAAAPHTGFARELDTVLRESA